MKIILETDRLILREINSRDEEVLFQLHSDPRVQQYTGEDIVATRLEIQESIKSRINSYNQYGYGRWATIKKDTMEFVGWAGLAYLPEFDQVDLGYRFFPNFWGQGIATEVSKAIINYGLSNLDIKEIIAIAMKENKASIRVMQKSGMQFYQIAPYDEQIKDAVWYICTKQQYKKAL